MLFNSYIFLFVFLPLTLIGFYTVARLFGSKAAKGLLVVASLVYYGWWNPSYLLLILASALVNFSLGKFLIRKPTKGLLSAGIAINLIALGYYKYANFFVDNINYLFEAGFTLKTIILPLAISFFTFQQVAYLVDTYRGETKNYTFLDYTLFVTFFPQLIAGPIVHHKEMMPQFERDETYKFQWDNLSIGLTLLSIGLFKKVIIADTLSPKVIKLFSAASAGSSLYMLDAWAGSLAYLFQIYFDFSGYCDMALGLSRFFGITLPLNFYSPYKATSIITFWRHWHMTLSRFLRDYLYIPLGGNRKGSLRRYVNLMITMILGGLWHGAGWTFLFWGFLHGFYLCVNHSYLKIKDHLPTLAFVPIFIKKGLGVILTLLAVLVAWVFFRAESFSSSITILASMFGLLETPALGTPHIIKTSFILKLIPLFVWVWFLPNAPELLRSFEPALDMPKEHSKNFITERLAWSPSIVWSIMVTFLLTASILSLSNVSEFLYYQF